MYRSAKVIGWDGVTLGLPGPETDTWKVTPACAELVLFFEPTLTLVKRPMTAEGRRIITLPLPLETLRPVEKAVTVGGDTATQCAARVDALRLVVGIIEVAAALGEGHPRPKCCDQDCECKN